LGEETIVSERRRALVNRILGLIGPSMGGRRFGNAEDLIGWAEEQTGLWNWGDPQFRGGLSALLLALEALPELSPLGVVTYDRMIRQALVNRLRFLGESIPRSEPRAPVIITGLPRSGTTALHRFLALDPIFHAPPLWELLDPFSDSSSMLRRWRTWAQIGFKNRLLPDLDQKHYTRADTAEECTLLLANSFSSPLFWDLAPLDGFLDWYQSTPQRSVYEDYRRQLEILQAHHPNQRLLLKAPAHLGNLAELQNVLPEASLIQTHRDPTKCFFSHCSLRETLGQLVMATPDRQSIASQVRRVFDHDLRANVAFHEQTSCEVAHVACSTLRRAPSDVLKDLRGWLDLSWTGADAQLLTDVLQRRPEGGSGGHRYSHEGWGVTREQVAGLFGDYRSTFAELLTG
jgi:hypothetical protein